MKHAPPPIRLNGRALADALGGDDQNSRELAQALEAIADSANKAHERIDEMYRQLERLVERIIRR